MRRKDREITENSEIESIIGNATVCRLAMSDDNKPYVVPMSFGYRPGALYFHSAINGRKIDILGKNPSVCFEFDEDGDLVKAETACEWGFTYRSVIGFGTASLIEDPDEKKEALGIIMSQYAEGSFTFPDKSVKNTVVIRVDIENMTGKGKLPA